MGKIRKTLKSGLERATRIINDLDHTFSFDEFRSSFYTDENERLSVSYCFDQCVERLVKADRFGTAISYKSAKCAFREFDPHLKLTTITPTLLYDFENFLISRKLSITTVGIYVRALRVVYNRAIDDGVITNEKYPFGLKVKRKYEIPKGNNIKKAIDIDTIQKIIKYESKNRAILFARDMWLFCFYCNGMNIGDVISLR